MDDLILKSGWDPSRPETLPAWLRKKVFPAPSLPEPQDLQNPQRPQELPRSVMERLRELMHERAKRKISALALYEPLPQQESFHASRAKERLLRGSNRGGKSQPAAIELARAVLGIDPHDKYPKRDGIAYIVGKDEKHLGETIYPKLFKAGAGSAFNIIRDEVTNQWRVYKPWLDKDRKHLAKPAPPLIPPSSIKSISWRKRGANIPDKIVLNTGWEITFWTSLGKPPQGMAIDLAWFDEEIIDSDWYPECKMRLMDKGGLFFWSATPQAGTERLLELHERASEQQHMTKPYTTEHFVHVKDNPYVSEEQKRETFGTLSGTDLAVRYSGEFVILTARIYPEWDDKIHGCPYFPIKDHWTIYVAVDPGRQVCAALFAAVPGPQDEEHGRIYFFDEIYIRNANAELFGERMERKLNRLNRTAYAFIIDRHGGKHTEGGTGLSLMDHYTRALKKKGVKSTQTGHTFWLSSDNPDADTEAARALLIPQESTGLPKLSVISEKCHEFVREIKKYRYPRIKGEIQEKIPHKGDVHLMDCFRYLAAHGLHYVKAKPTESPVTGILAVLKREQEAEAAKRGGNYVRLGAGEPIWE